jgi:hypothetical protein
LSEGRSKVGDAPLAEPTAAVPTQVDTLHCVGASGAGHTAQAAAPAAADCPGGQGAHAAAPAPAAVPAGQGSARAVGSQKSVPGQNEPAGHGAQARLALVNVPGAHAGKGEGVNDAVPVTVAVRDTVGVRVPVNVGSPEGVTLRVGEGVPVGEPVSEGVPVGDAPADGVAVGDAVTEAVRVVLRVTVGVRVAVTDAVFEPLGVGGGQEGGAPSSTRRTRLLRLSVTHSVVPATARPEGELNRAAVPSAKPPPGSPESVVTTAAGHAVTSATTRMLWLRLSAM